MKRFAARLVAVLALALLSSPALAQSPGKVYTYGLWPTMGAQSNTLNNYIKNIVQIVFDRAGEKVKFVEIDKDAVMNAIKTKKVDFIYVTPDQYVELMNAKAPIHPVFAPGAKGHVRDNLCFVALKSNAARSANDLRGKSLTVTSAFGDFISLRAMMIGKGINEPMNKIFKSGLTVENDSTILQNVIDSKADVAAISNHGLNFQKYVNAAYKSKTRIVDCGEIPWPAAPVVWIGTPDPKALKKVYEVLPLLDSYPEFKKYQPLLKMLQFQLNLVSDKDYKEMIKYYNDAKKKGWRAEFIALGGK